MRGLEARLARVRDIRASPGDRAEALGGEIEHVSKDVLKRARGNVEIAEVWRQIVPAEIAEHAWPVGLSRGTLTIAARGAAWRSRVDQWLRGGGQREFVARVRVGVKKVKVVDSSGVGQ